MLEICRSSGSKFRRAAGRDLPQSRVQLPDRGVASGQVQIGGLHFGENAVEVAVFQAFDDDGLAAGTSTRRRRCL